MPMKVLFFSGAPADDRRMGWSFVLYNSGDIGDDRPVPSTNALLNRALDVRTALRALTGGQTVINRIRFSDVDVSRRVYVHKIPDTGNAYGNTDLDTMYPTVAVGLFTQYAGGYYQRQWLRGIEGFATDVPGSRPDRTWLADKILALNALLGTTTNGWIGRCLDRNRPKIPIATYVPGTGIFTTSVPHGLANGAKIQIYGSGPNSDVNGRYRVNTVDTTTFKVGPTTPTVGFIDPNVHPYLRPILFVADGPAIKNIAVERLTSHVTGVFTDQQRGRRRRRRRR